MAERNYKNLNLDRAAIDGLVDNFAAQHQFTVESIGNTPGSQNGKRVVFGRIGTPYATVNVFFIKDGTSTIQFLTGLNPELGKQLADYLYDSINPAEFEQVNMVLEGFIEAAISPVLDLTAEESHIQVVVHSHDANRIVWKIQSKEYQDELTVTLHIGTRRLQIQGRPLSCYRVFIFNLSELLDLQGLEKVLIRQEDGKAEIVQQEVARSYLRSVLGESYDQLHSNVEKLLISGLCVKLASPNLPDYCMLLYPELRSIEGALKSKLKAFGIVVGKDGFGEFFVKDQGVHILNADCAASCPNAEAAKVISEAYTFYNRERHGLFHMEVLVEASRVISNITHLMTKSTQAWDLIKKLYTI
ncbi:type II toxin-antitoxin system RnlA family toxin [Shewanella cyperi]|uniref:Type II toxin-antitoxin system RnlA family toxin n=1 Tax=Shewanella cyperi TaxID=2814292 RepID=A0A974XN38_9GAMM|nr:type II toxin-antitoxin system RnlA family toxin [Shewanella cyperi]QSX30101.1 type II toxin-antitoxin system RnlA family toxin [Shewanella cyperi]